MGPEDENRCDNRKLLSFKLEQDYKLIPGQQIYNLLFSTSVVQKITFNLSVKVQVTFLDVLRKVGAAARDAGQMKMVLALKHTMGCDKDCHCLVQNLGTGTCLVNGYVLYSSSRKSLKFHTCTVVYHLVTGHCPL